MRMGEKTRKKKKQKRIKPRKKNYPFGCLPIPPL